MMYDSPRSTSMKDPDDGHAVVVSKDGLDLEASPTK